MRKRKIFYHFYHNFLTIFPFFCFLSNYCKFLNFFFNKTCNVAKFYPVTLVSLWSCQLENRPVSLPYDTPGDFFIFRFFTFVLVAS